MAGLTSITPADGAIEVWGNQHFVALLEDPSAVDVALVEIIVNGESCTLANGLLEYWGHKKIAGGAIVDDWTAVYVGTRGRWFDLSHQEIDVEVVYDSVTLDTITVRVAAFEGDPSAAQGYYEAWSTAPDWQAGRATGHYVVLDYYTAAAEKPGYYYVQPPSESACDGWYLVGHYITSDGPAAAVVGETCITDGPAAAIVRGWTATDGPASGLVQAWVRVDGPAAGLPATLTVSDGAAAAIMGVLTTSDGAAAAIVYGVSRRTHVEVRSVSAETAAMLAALGVTRA